MDKDTLHEIELQIIQEQIDIAPYGGTAFFNDDKEEMKFWKGQYVALERLRKWVSKKSLELLIEETVARRESKTLAKHVQEQMAALKDYDHKLFDQIVEGLVTEGWKENGGSPTYRLLEKEDVAIKVFRNEEAPAVIKICFSAEPEEVKVEEEKTESTF